MPNNPLVAVDLRWSNAGDLVLDHDGDLADTATSRYASFIQEVITRIQSSFYDWATQPSLGANLDELIGEPNSKESAEAGKTNIISALTRDSFCPKGQLNVSYMPVSPTILMYRLKISLTGFGDDDTFTLSFLFNTNDYEVTIL